MSSDHPPAASGTGFRQWLRQHRLDDWQRLVALADSDIAAMAETAGIDWSELRQHLPPAGQMLKGSHLATLGPRDRGRSAFVWHLRDDRYGNTWPCLLFMSFRHGGVHQIFHGYRWAWLRYQQGAAPAAGITTNRFRMPVLDGLIDQARQEREQHWRTERFHEQHRLWHQAARAEAGHPLLQARLCGHATPDLLERLDLRHIRTARGDCLAVRLLHRQHGLCGFQQLHGRPLDAGGRTQHLVIRASGMKRGAFACIRASAGCEHWPVAICEGVFTALSVALGWPGPVAIALDAGNLAAVRAMIERPCVFFADNDAWSTANTGLRSARRASRPGDRIAFPAFAGEHHPLKPSDFNDLLRLSGIDALRRQIRPLWPERN